jgi:hypothetical protein
MGATCREDAGGGWGMKDGGWPTGARMVWEQHALIPAGKIWWAGPMKRTMDNGLPALFQATWGEREKRGLGSERQKSAEFPLEENATLHALH